MKKDAQGSLKPIGVESPGQHREVPAKLEKRPSKKLVIKANDKKNEDVPAKFTEKIEESESMVIHEQRMLNKPA
jgi:predicted house-cleaning NTP pyrophosphatase (Maf/HAM1 superfamily)